MRSNSIRTAIAPISAADCATAVIGAMPEPRISLTYPALESSADILFLVSGAAKREILARVLANDRALPASRIAARGAIRIFADRAALTD